MADDVMVINRGGRPQAQPEGGEDQETNVFKKAANYFMFGSTDPTTDQVGERASSAAFNYNMGMARIHSTSAPGVSAGYAARAPQAAQAMRERYYRKEYGQVQATQIKPMMEEMHSITAEAKAKLSVSNMPIPRTVSYEEAESRKLDVASMQPGVPQPGPPVAGKDGKSKPGKSIMTPPPGMHAPSPASQGDPSTMNAVEYTEETPAIIDPLTGQPVPVASARGIAIQQEVFNDLGENHKRIQLQMMDTYGQYSGNPFIHDAMTKMIESVMNNAGTAVTGRSDPAQAQEWWASQQESQIRREGMQSENDERALNLETTLAKQQALASEAKMLVEQGDKAFLSLLPKGLRKAAGKDIENMTPKQLTELSSMVSLYRERQAADLALRKSQGLMTIPTARMEIPNTWHNFLNVSDNAYKAIEQEEFAKLTTGISQNLSGVGAMSASQQDKLFANLGVPSELKPLLRQGLVNDPKVTDWIQLKAMGSDEYEDAKATAYMARMEEIGQEQPEVLAKVQSDNAEWVQRWAEAQRSNGVDVTTDMIDQLRADVWGTHYAITHDRVAPSERPPMARAALAEYQARLASREVAPVLAPAITEAVNMDPEAFERDLRRSSKARAADTERAPSVGQYLQRMEAETMPDEAITGETPVAALSQPQLESEMKTLRQFLSTPQVLQNDDLRFKLHKRYNELADAHYNTFERGLLSVTDLFIDTDEEKAVRADKARQKNTEILQHIPKVN